MLQLRLRRCGAEAVEVLALVEAVVEVEGVIEVVLAVESAVEVVVLVVFVLAKG